MSTTARGVLPSNTLDKVMPSETFKKKGRTAGKKSGRKMEKGVKDKVPPKRGREKEAKRGERGVGQKKPKKSTMSKRRGIPHVKIREYKIARNGGGETREKNINARRERGGLQ